jgi:hypothetical protein
MGHLLPVMIADPEAQEKRRVPSTTAPIATADSRLDVGNRALKLG